MKRGLGPKIVKQTLQPVSSSSSMSLTGGFEVSGYMGHARPHSHAQLKPVPSYTQHYKSKFYTVPSYTQQYISHFYTVPCFTKQYISTLYTVPSYSPQSFTGCSRIIQFCIYSVPFHAQQYLSIFYTTHCTVGPDLKISLALYSEPLSTVLLYRKLICIFYILQYCNL